MYVYKYISIRNKNMSNRSADARWKIRSRVVFRLVETFSHRRDISPQKRTIGPSFYLRPYIETWYNTGHVSCERIAYTHTHTHTTTLTHKINVYKCTSIYILSRKKNACVSIRVRRWCVRPTVSIKSRITLDTKESKTSFSRDRYKHDTRRVIYTHECVSVCIVI